MYNFVDLEYEYNMETITYVYVYVYYIYIYIYTHDWEEITCNRFITRFLEIILS